MTTTHSRMNFINLRDRRSQQQESDQVSLAEAIQDRPKPSDAEAPKLVLPEASYEPTNPFTNSRTAMRMLKGKIDRGVSIEKEKNAANQEDTRNAFVGSGISQAEMNHTFKPKPEEKKSEAAPWNTQTEKAEAVQQIKLPPRPAIPMAGMKLVLPDEDVPQEKKPTSGNQFSASKEGFGRRILIEPSKETKQQPQVVQQLPISQIAKAEVINSEPITETRLKEDPKQQQKEPALPPKEQPDPEDIQNDNELIECPEGCGRKFNKKALEPHAKACKIVFMSKRKEFNSQAKRVTNKEQANLVKQAKQKEKKQLMGTTKFEKTGEAWKTQSQGFRAVVKALKQQEIVPVDEVKTVACEFCEKKFNELLLSKHLLICEAKKEKQQRKGTKKPTKQP